MAVTEISVTDLRPKMELKGVVKRIELAGAFIDIGTGKDALLHISQMARRRVNNVQDVLSEGQEVTVWVQSLNAQTGQVKLTMIKPAAVEWDEIAVGQTYTGKVVRLEKFGAFVDIGAERTGLVHVSEIAEGYIKSPEEVLKRDQEVQVKVISVDRAKHQIDLSIKALTPTMTASDDQEAEEHLPTSLAAAFERAKMSQKAQPSNQRTSQSAQESARRRARQDEIIRRTLEQHVKD